MTMRTKRKRMLIIDKEVCISDAEMKSQLSDTTDIVAIFESSPPTKKLMHLKEIAGVEKLFGIPGHQIISKTLSRGFLKHLTTRSVENEEFWPETFDQLEKGTSSKQKIISNGFLSLNSHQLVKTRTPVNYLKSNSPSAVLITPDLSTDTSQ